MVTKQRQVTAEALGILALWKLRQETEGLSLEFLKSAMKPKGPDPVCGGGASLNLSILEAETDQRISVRWMSAWSMGKPRL